MIRRIVLAAVLSAAACAAADDAVMRAMRDELGRSMKKLQLENLEKPYFVSYRAVETNNCTAAASFGAITRSDCEHPSATMRTRNFSVEVRVGSNARDNTNFYAPRLSVGGVVRISTDGGMTAPVDDNYDEIRRQLWLGTDSAYKTALDVYAKKKAALENRTRTDDAPDFSKEPVFTYDDPAQPVAWTKTEVESLVKGLSKLFRETPGIDNSEVRITVSNWLVRYLNSEGSSFTRRDSHVQLVIGGDTQATDGMPLTDFETLDARSLKELPAHDEIVKRIRTLQARIENMRKAAMVEKYTGPVLFEGQAAAELFAQGMGSSLVGVPRVVVDDMRFEKAYNSNAGLADRIGSRVLPGFLSITDNPAAKEFQGQPLFGGYPVDDDAVKTGPTQLVDQGILKALLHTRALLPGTTQSTASRRGNGPMPSNLLVTAEKGLSPEELKAELLRIAKQRGKEYGIVVRRMGNPMMQTTLARSRVIIMTSGGQASIEVEPLIEAYKVFPDGHEEPARNLTVNGLTFGAFKDIVAVSKTPYVYTAPVRMTIRSPMMAMQFIALAGPTVVSMAVPSMLFEDMTLQRPSGDVPNLPFSRHPFFDSK